MSRSGRVAVVVAVLAVGGALGDVALRLAAGEGRAVLAMNSTGGDAIAVGYGLAGLYLARARPRHVLGWLLLAVGLTQGLAGLAGGVAVSLEPSGLQTFAAWWASWTFFLGFGPIPTVLVLLYPTGRAGRWRRRVVGASLAGTAAIALALALAPDAVDDVVPGLANPVAVPALTPVLAIAGAALLLPCVLLTLVDAVLRVRRARSPEREQLLWLLLTVLVTVGTSYLPLGEAGLVLHVLVPTALAVGVVRHRLLDLQVVVRRALLFGALTACVVAVFVVATSLLSGPLGGDTLPVALAAGLVAVGLTPARERLQRGVDRLVYGERRDPMRAVDLLGRGVAEHDDAVLVPQVLVTVAAAVRSPHVALLHVDGAVQAQAGEPAGGEPLHLPLQVGGRDVGCLVVAPRTARDGWSADDRRLLEVLARQVAVVVHAAALHDELAASRDRVLEATALERQRLHQELHDGLGPALSGIALGLEAAEVALEPAPQRTAELLARLRSETQAAGREVRRLVEGLRPAALDRQSLAAALTDFVTGLDAALAGRMDVALDVAPDVPGLGPEVDAAAYRIVTEAVTNVVRHSGAHTCRVAVHVDGGRLVLVLVVEDDGSGLPQQPRDGVGLASVRRRAAGLGGTWTAGPREGGGTRVEVCLPLVRTEVLT
jgi:signal transduction histidine kinase